VDDPFAYIAEELGAKSYGTPKMPSGKAKRRVSLDQGKPLKVGERKVSVTAESYEEIERQEQRGESRAEAELKPRKPSVMLVAPPLLEEDEGDVEAADDQAPSEVTKEGRITGEELKREYTQAAGSVDISQDLVDLLKAFFDKMDQNGDGSVTKEEAIAFWGKNFAKVNSNSMFNEVDENGDESITWEEFLEFWKNVVSSGYDPDDVKEEVEMMLEGGSWVDFDDGRTT